MKNVPRKKILFQLIILTLLFHAIIIGGVIWGFRLPTEQSMVIIFLAEVILWLIFAKRIAIRYECAYSSPLVGRGVRHFLFGPYFLIAGLVCAIGLALPNDRGERIGTYYRKYGGTEIGGAYKNDKQNREGNVVLGIMALVLVPAGTALCISGYKKLGKTDLKDAPGKETQLLEEKADLTANKKIGDQVWLTKNLNTSSFRNGDPIPEVTEYREWARLIKKNKPAWCYYENDTQKGTEYGKLYNWYAVSDPRGLAPEGWHISSETEWKQIIDSLGDLSSAGVKMKSNAGWVAASFPNKAGTNESGFNGLPGGVRKRNGRFKYAGYLGCWWSSTNKGEKRALFFGLHNELANVIRKNDRKQMGFSVRCVKD